MFLALGSIKNYCSSYSLPMKYLTGISLGFVSDLLLPSLFTICGSLLALSLIVVSTKSSLWAKIRSTRNTGNREDLSLSYITPLYVQRITQIRHKLAAQRRVTQRSFKVGLLWCNESDNDTQYDCELLKRRREKIREKKKERLTKRPRINPEKLKRINQKWHKVYGFKNGDLFHIENELENTVAKVPSVHSKKDKAIRFDNSVNVVYIEKDNTGRRVNRSQGEVSRSAVKFTEMISEQQIIV